MTIAASPLVRPSLHPLVFPGTVTIPAGVYASPETSATPWQRLGSRLLDGGILIAGVWSIPFVIIAMGAPIALGILGVLQLIRLLQNAF